MATPNKQPLKKPAPAKPQLPKGPFHFTGRKFNLLFILSVIGLCFVLYGNSIPNGFALDDEFVLHNDTTVAKGISGIPDLFKTRYAWDQKGGYGYRPMVKVSFALEYVLFKDSAHWGHFINILLYAFICIFLFYFLRKLLYSRVSDYFLLIALALYITHPIHSEVVASLKNRDELLVLLFGLYCCYATMKWFEADEWQKRVLWGFSGCLSLGLGALCKPDAIIFIPITAMILYFFSSKGARAAILSVLFLTISLLLGNRFMHKHVLPPTTYHRSFVYIENPLVGVHWYHKFPLAFSTVWFYISKMLFPKDLVCYYGYNAFDSFPKWTDCAVLAGIVLTGFLIYLVVKNLKKKTALLFFLLLFCGTLFPYTDLFQVGAGIVAERFMFIPSIAFMVLIVYMAYYFLKIPIEKKPVGQAATYIYAFTLGVCIIFTARVIARNPDWKSHQSIYLHDSQVAPQSAKLQSLLAATYIEEAQKLKVTNPGNKASLDSLYRAGEKGYQNSVNIYPGYGTSWNNLGMIQFTLYGNLQNAIVDFKRALGVDSEYTEALFNMGASYESLGNRVRDTINAMRRDSTVMSEKKIYGKDTKEIIHEKISACESRLNNLFALSEQSYLHTIKLKPAYHIAYLYLSRLYFIQGKYQKVIDFDQEAIDKGNTSDVVYVTMGNAYLMSKDTANAVINYEKSLQFYDKNDYIFGFLNKFYLGKGDLQKARYYKEKYDAAVMFKNNRAPGH